MDDASSRENKTQIAVNGVVDDSHPSPTATENSDRNARKHEDSRITEDTNDTAEEPMDIDHQETYEKISNPEDKTPNTDHLGDVGTSSIHYETQNCAGPSGNPYRPEWRWTPWIAPVIRPNSVSSESCSSNNDHTKSPAPVNPIILEQKDANTSNKSASQESTLSSYLIDIEDGSSSSDTMSESNSSLLCRLEVLSDESDQSDEDGQIAIQILSMPGVIVNPTASVTEQSFYRSQKPVTDDADGNTHQRNRPKYLEVCEVCSVPASLVCGNCFKVTYCSKEHQMDDWKEKHMRACLHISLYRSPAVIHAGPFKVEKYGVPLQKETQAFHMQAACNIAQGTTVLEEKPFLISPWPRSRLRKSELALFKGLAVRSLSCFGCCKYIGFNYIQCRECNLPLCSRACNQVVNHKENECQFMKELLQRKISARFDFKNLIKNEDNRAMELLYTDVMMLRLLLKVSNIGKLEGESKQGEIWSKLSQIWHLEIQKRASKSRTGKRIFHALDENLPLTYYAAKENHEFVWKLYCIVESNSFNFDLPFRRFRALCTVLSQARHSCSPNCHAYFEEPAGNHESDLDEIKIVLKSGRIIKEGDSITFSYCPAILGTLERRPRLMNTYLFWCKCPRCLDPTECGTHISTLVCPNCSIGRMTPPISILQASPNYVCEGFNAGIIGCMNNPWACDSFKCRRSPPNVVGKSFLACSTTAYLLGRTLDLEQESLKFTGQHVHAMNFASTRPVVRHLHRQHAVHVKQWEDILRGALFPLADFSYQSLNEFCTGMLAAVKEAKVQYEIIMKMINPAFNFQGFPLLNIQMMENEHSIRRDYPIDIDSIIERDLQMIRYRNGYNPPNPTVPIDPAEESRRVIRRAGGPRPAASVSFRSMNI